MSKIKVVVNFTMTKIKLEPKSAFKRRKKHMPTEADNAKWHAMKGYKLCTFCRQPLLKKGQKRKHPTDYRHATGCPFDPISVKRWKLLRKAGVSDR